MDKIKVKMLEDTEGVKEKQYYPTLFKKGKVYDLDLSLAKNFEIMKVIEVLEADYVEPVVLSNDETDKLKQKLAEKDSLLAKGLNKLINDNLKLKEKEEKLDKKEDALNDRKNTLKEKEEYLNAKEKEFGKLNKMDNTEIENKMVKDVPENKGKKVKPSGKGAKK